VLLKTEDDKKRQFTGMGFFYTFFKENNRGVVAIITNRHVVDGQKKISSRWTKKNVSGQPDFGNHIDAVLDDLDNRVILHPDKEIDLAMIAISDKLNQYAASTPVYEVDLDESLVPSKEALNDFQPLEDILVVGYPDGLSDIQNNIPIFRRGITATPVYMNYAGKPQFMVDAAIYHGSSGSPVFLYNAGMWMDRDGGIHPGTRISLLGVVWGVFEQPTEGEIRLVPAPTQFQPKTFSKIPHNLGVNDEPLFPDGFAGWMD
jgi:hypothetical protein